MAKIQVFYFLSIAVFVLIILMSLNYITMNSMNDYKFKSSDQQNLKISKFKNNKPTCNPINHNYIHKRFKIDNEIFPKSYPLYLNSSINFKCINSSSKNKIKTILLWNGFFERPSYGFDFGRVEPFKKNLCPVTNCELTNDRSRINQSDFVIVHMRNKIDPPPNYRPHFQRWVFALYESPVHSDNYSIYNGVFNLTSSFRLDADFPRLSGSYKRFYWQKSLNFDENYDFLGEKIHEEKFAAAVISNCGAGSRRLDYINKLSNFIKVDVFGRCGKPCPNRSKIVNSVNCKEIIGNEYKFYLSFENSVCKDYITEKFFEILKYNIIPVVLGDGDYSHLVRYSIF